MRSPQTVIKRPLLTEKSARLRETGGAAQSAAEGEAYAQKVVFEVARDANKIDIRRAVEQLFKVSVTGVNTINRIGKRKRTRTGFGQRAATKRAIVTLAEGDLIDIFGGPTA